MTRLQSLKTWIIKIVSDIVRFFGLYPERPMPYKIVMIKEVK